MTNGRFEEKNRIDAPGIVGAEWWQEGVVASQTDIGRRKALLHVALGAACFVGVGAAVAAFSGPSEDRDDRPAIDVQRQTSWSFGANAETLTYTDVVEASPPSADLRALADLLAPKRPDLRPFYGPALFQALTPAAGNDPTAPPTARPLVETVPGIDTPAMKAAYALGQALAATVPGNGVVSAYVVDLPGPESVAFAAGAVGALDPVFRFDNWPHPRGIVPAHHTLAAAVRHRKAFAQAPATKRPPLFVLDRNRLLAYTDETRQFDNRYMATLPTLPQLMALPATRLFYVSRDGKDADDLNAALAALDKGYLPVRLVSTDDLAPSRKRPAMLTDPSRVNDPDWAQRRPIPRATPYSDSSGQRTVPPSFGLVPVIIVGGLLAGPMFARDSWNRSYGSPGS